MQSTPTNSTTQYEVSALIESYKHATSHIIEFAKLQYQLVGVAYTITGIALTILGSSSSRAPTFVILFFPPIFCAIVLVQLYLHSTMKSYGRYVNFRLRPRIEAILNSGQLDIKRMWDWEDQYRSVRPNRVFRLIIRQLGSIINLLSLLPGFGAWALYWLLTPSDQRAAWTVLITLDVLPIVITAELFVLVKMINGHWWKLEQVQQKRDQQARNALDLGRLKQAHDKLKAGDWATAQQLITDVIKGNPLNSGAWYLMSFVGSTSEEQVSALRRAVELNPENLKAQSRLHKFDPTIRKS